MDMEYEIYDRSTTDKRVYVVVLTEDTGDALRRVLKSVHLSLEGAKDFIKSYVSDRSESENDFFDIMIMDLNK